MYRVQTVSTIKIGSVVFPYNGTNPNEFVAVTSSRLSARLEGQRQVLCLMDGGGRLNIV